MFFKFKIELKSLLLQKINENIKYSTNTTDHVANKGRLIGKTIKKNQ